MFCWYERENRVCFFLGLDDEDEGMFMICCDSIFGGSICWVLGWGCVGICWKYLCYFRLNYVVVVYFILEWII